MQLSNLKMQPTAGFEESKVKKAANQHVLIDKSSNIEVSGCYFHESFDYDSPSGYGVVMYNGTGECLIENNIFKTLRHSIMLQYAANGNVVSHNYLTDSRDDDGAGNSDLVFHGNYPFRNLIEGNSCEHLHFDTKGCDNGPKNVVFRNNARTQNISAGWWPFGITATEIACVANESNQCINLIGNSHDSWDNDEGGPWSFCLGGHGPNGDNTANGNSILYAVLPPFMTGITTMPVFGPGSLNAAILPAEQRFNSGQIRTVGDNCEECGEIPPPPLVVTATVWPCATDGIGHQFPGSIMLSITGGTPPYSTAWGPGVINTTTTDADFLNPVFWTATVTDANGVMFMISGFTGPCDEMFKQEAASAETEEKTFEISVYPNPSNGNASLKMELPKEELMKIEIYAIDGRKIRDYSPSAKLTSGIHELAIEGIPQGIYILRVIHGTEIRSLRLISQ